MSVSLQMLAAKVLKAQMVSDRCQLVPYTKSFNVVSTCLSVTRTSTRARSLSQMSLW